MAVGSLGVNLYADLYGSDKSSEYVPPPDPVPNNALVDDSGNYILYNGDYIIYDL